jgi:hypothetical protein
MREGLKQHVTTLLSNYLEDLRYWCEVHEADGINSVTAGTPPFDTLEDANAYRVMVKAVLKEFKDG